MTDPDIVDIVTMLRSPDRFEPHMCNAAADEIERLRAERDEARREVCSMNETGLRMNESDKRREAKRRGWDCWEEAKP
jgi:hypothetical protein